MIPYLRCFLQILAIYMTVTSTGPALGQDKTEGTCSPIIKEVGGDVKFVANCPTVFGASFTYSFSNENSEILRKFFGVNEEAIQQLLSRMNRENVPPYKFTTRIKELVEENEYLRSQLDSYENVESAQKLVSKLRRSLDIMDIDASKAAFRELIEQYQTISNKQKSIENIRNVARGSQDYGRLLMSTNDYDEAFKQFKNAIEWLPGKFEAQLLELRVELATAAQLGSVDPRTVKKLVDEAVFYAQQMRDTNSTIYLKALQLQIRQKNGEGDFQGSLDLFEKEFSELQPQLKDLVLDSENVSLCLSCLAEAARQLEQYELAVKITKLALQVHKENIDSRPESLVSVYINGSLALSSLGKEIEAEEFRKKALEIIEWNAPDGLDPAYPYVWLAFADATDDPENSKEYHKKAIISIAQNVPLANDSMTALLAPAFGAQGGIFCLGPPGEIVELNDDFVREPPLHDFDPDTCPNAVFPGLKFSWKESDFLDLKMRMTRAVTGVFKNAEIAWPTVALSICTEMIVNGWQSQGKELCTEVMPKVIGDNILNEQTAEGAFRLANFSFRAGYDFEIEDQILHQFSYQAALKVRGANHEYTEDAAQQFANYLCLVGKENEAKLIQDERQNVLESMDSHYASEARIFWKKLRNNCKPAQEIRPKRTQYSGPRTLENQ